MASATQDLRLPSRSLSGTKLYRLVTEAYVCEQLAQGCYLKEQDRESNLRPFSRKLNDLTSSIAIGPHCR